MTRYISCILNRIFYSRMTDPVRPRFQHFHRNITPLFVRKLRFRKFAKNIAIVPCEMKDYRSRDLHNRTAFRIWFPFLHSTFPYSISIHFLPIFAYLFLASCLNKDSSFLFRSIFSISAYLLLVNFCLTRFGQRKIHFSNSTNNWKTRLRVHPILSIVLLKFITSKIIKFRKP